MWISLDNHTYINVECGLLIKKTYEKQMQIGGKLYSTVGGELICDLTLAGVDALLANMNHDEVEWHRNNVGKTIVLTFRDENGNVIETKKDVITEFSSKERLYKTEAGRNIPLDYPIRIID